MSANVAVERVTKRFGAQVVLDGVDIAVEQGEIVTLLGPSGCGKTTLLRLIAGLATPDEGRVRISGLDVTRTPPHKRNVGVVFQNYALFPHLDVKGNVGFGLKGKGLSREVQTERVARALDLVQLGKLADRPISTLSGGQSQRVALARALALEPSVLLFDEALSALDRSLREAMQAELRRLLKSLGATAVFVTHDQEEALTMSDRVAVINAGRIEHFSEPRDVYARPRTLFAMRFVGVCSEIPGEVAAREAGMARVETAQGLVLAHGSAAVGERVVVATRPEHVAIGEGEGDRLAAEGDRLAGEGNRLAGIVRQVVFQGSRTRVSVDVGAPKDFLAEFGGAGEAPRAGERVTLRWPVAQSFAYVAAS